MPLGVGLIAAVPLLCTPVGLFVSPWLGVALAFVCGLAVIIGGSMRWGGALVFAGIMATCSGVWAVMGFSQYREACVGETVADVAPAEAPRLTEATAFVFTGEIPRRDLSGSHVRTVRQKDGGSSSTTFTAWPVVYEGWREGRPVPVWACDRSDSYRSRNEAPRRVAMRISALDRDGYERAARAAEERHGLTTCPGAPYVYFVVSREAEIERLRKTAWGLTLLFQAIWIVGMPIARLWGG